MKRMGRVCQTCNKDKEICLGSVDCLEKLKEYPMDESGSAREMTLER